MSILVSIVPRVMFQFLCELLFITYSYILVYRPLAPRLQTCPMTYALLVSRQSAWCIAYHMHTYGPHASYKQMHFAHFIFSQVLFWSTLAKYICTFSVRWLDKTAKICFSLHTNYSAWSCNILWLVCIYIAYICKH